MITRRTFLGTAAGVGVLSLVPGTAAEAAGKGTKWTGAKSANGWRITPSAISTYRIEGSRASVALRQGVAAAVLLHIARRWHYEIAPVDTGDGGGITGHTTDREIQAKFQSNYLSGTALAVQSTAFPLGGSEKLWPYQEEIVRDILLDCEGTVAWGGDLNPAQASHFHLAVAPGDKTLAGVAARLDTSVQLEFRAQTAGVVADPATPSRRDRARRLPRRR
ncbi:hypothetical protein [Micromonospora sp. NPDC049679]|uniref:hypothetical protein n=1 Tax=Micromonospora sp. NPDC049679 TaxID=3155920 RepID=UPI0033FB62A0